MLNSLKAHFQKPLENFEDEDIQSFLDGHLKVKSEVDMERKNKGLTTSECLDTLKRMSIDTYVTSEKIGDEVLDYDPIPGGYYCGDLEELTGGKRWSLD